MSGLRNLNILASQASEFEYNKNRTEGKTGRVKPDLIPSKTNDTSPKRNTIKVGSETGAGTSGTNNIRKPSPKPSPRTSPLKSISETSQEEAAAAATNGMQPTVETKKNDISESTSIKHATSIVDLTSELEPSPQKKQPIAIVDLTQESQMVDNKPAKVTTEKITKESKIDKNEPIVAVTNDLIIAEKKAESKDKPSVSTRFNGTTRPTLVRSKGSLLACKPPNILVYSDSSATRDSVISTLTSILETDM